MKKPPYLLLCMLALPLLFFMGIQWAEPQIAKMSWLPVSGGGGLESMTMGFAANGHIITAHSDE